MDIIKGNSSVFSRFYVLIIANLVLFACFTGFAQKPSESYRIKKIVIDAGHGGKDPGNLGTGRYKKTESDIVLDVALLVEKYMGEHLPDVEVVMTRDTDVFLELYERTKMANDENAQLFVSIHCNAAASVKAFGSETYVLGMHKQEANMEVAKRENQVMFLEDNYDVNYAGFDNSPEAMIALSLQQGEFRTQSIYMASLVQDQFRERVSRRDRGVREAGFWVISRTSMPSILIELGFLTNSTEEDFLNTENGKVYMASAIYRAIRDYKAAIDEPIDESKHSDDPITGKVDKVISQTMYDSPVNSQDSVFFMVQLASTREQVETLSQNFKGVEGVEEYKTDKVYKYVVGKEVSFEDAVVLQRSIRENSYKDAFIVGMQDGQLISLQEALEILRNSSQKL